MANAALVQQIYDWLTLGYDSHDACWNTEYQKVESFASANLVWGKHMFFIVTLILRI